MKDATPRGVSFSHSGLTVRRNLTRREVRSNLFFGALTLASVLVYVLPMSVWGMVPPGKVEFVADLAANLFLAAPFCGAWTLYASWRFATQPTLRLTPHAIIMAPRWASWRPTHRFSLGTVRIRAGRERWEEDMDCAVIHLEDGERSASLRLEPLDPDAVDTGASKLDWVVGHLEAAQDAYAEGDDDDRRRAEEALKVLRDRAVESSSRRRYGGRP